MLAETEVDVALQARFRGHKSRACRAEFENAGMTKNTAEELGMLHGETLKYWLQACSGKGSWLVSPVTYLRVDLKRPASPTPYSPTKSLCIDDLRPGADLKTSGQALQSSSEHANIIGLLLYYRPTYILSENH